MKTQNNQAELWKSAAWDMLYLTGCGIHAYTPAPERVAKMDLSKVYALSRGQSLESITYMALEQLMKQDPSLQIRDPEHVLNQWEESKHKAIRKTMLMNAEREELFSYLEKQGIWHLPLKGVVLYQLYPEFGMRQMADNDILFDASFREDVRNWFAGRGYAVESYQKSNHDEYHKNPIYNFEMHTDLFDERAYPQFAQHYQTLKDRLHPVPGKAFEYRMTDEEFYLYMLAHEYKHYSNSGTGLRSLLDVYVYNKAKSTMDRASLNEELKKLGLTAFERDIRELSLKIFTPDFQLCTLSETERNTLYEFLYSRTYGTIEIYWKRKTEQMQAEGTQFSTSFKIKYFLRRLFPGKAHMEIWCELYAPFFLRHRRLMPLASIWRVIKLGGGNKKALQVEFNAIRNM